MTKLEILELIDTIFHSDIKTNSLHEKSPVVEKIAQIISQSEPYDKEVDSLSRKFIFNQQKQSVLDYYANEQKKKYEYRHYVFSMLRDQFKDEILKNIYEIDWVALLPLLKETYTNIYAINPISNDKEKKIHDVIHSKYLSPYKIKTEDGHVLQETDKLKRIAKKIDSLVKELGGKNVLNCILAYLNQTSYNSAYKRYLFPKRYHQYTQDLVLAFPINYLLNLSLKNIHYKGKYLPERCEYLIELSKEFLFLYDLQDFHNTDFMLIPMNFDKASLYRHLFYDNIFRVLHANWSLFPNLLEQLLSTDKKQSDSFYEDNGFSLADYIRIIHKLYDEPRIENTLPTELYEDAFSENEQKILNKLSSPYGANQNYLLPTDFDKLTMTAKPLIKMGKKYFFLQKPFLAWSFYNFIAERNGNQKYINIGNNIEQIIKKVSIKTNAYSVYSGIYQKKKGENAECDIVIEDSKYIIFIEVKKKAITKISLKGENKSELLFDLSSMLITSQAQALGHECYLREKKKISFDDGKILQFNGQKIYRLSVTLYDSYMFNDHFITMYLMDYLSGINFNFINEDTLTPQERKDAIARKNIDIVNKKGKILNSEVETLKARFDISHRENRFYSYFLSLEQLLFLFEESEKNKKSLGELLDNMKNCSCGAGDFYAEYFEIQRIKNAKTN